MNFKTLAGAVALAFLPPVAWASEGHDHGGEATASAGAAQPRFTAASELFELVGIVDGRQLVVYLDRFADGAPVKAATLDLSVGGAKVELKERSEGEFEGTLADALKTGVTPVTATIVAGKDTDLLAADLDVHDEMPRAAPTRNWKPVAAWAGGAALLLLAAWVFMRRRQSRPLQGAA